MPYVGHNRLYEISGWDEWQRRSGSVSRPDRAAGVTRKGTGLTGRYYEGSKLVLETVESPIYYERFGGERHAGKFTPHYKAVWTGFVEPPVTDQYQFSSLLGKNEQVAVWIDGRVTHANGMSNGLNNKVDLIAGHRHRIQIEYINPDGRAELMLLWSSRVVDPSQIPRECLYAEPRHDGRSAI
jgi:hypothetical protein